MLLLECEITQLQKVKEVFTWHVLHAHVIVFISLKQINQFDDISVLAHFQNFDFSSLLSDFNRCHFFLQDWFYSDLLLRSDMSCYIHNTELALTDHVLHLIELEDVFSSCGSFQLFDPFVLKVLIVKKQYSYLSLS